MDQKKVGGFLAQLRREAGLTQEALGRELGVTNKTVSRWENGNYLPDVEMLLLLSRRYGVTINELLSGGRLGEDAYRQAAEENLVAALKGGVFSTAEQLDYWKKKWRREHMGLMVLCAVAVAALYAAALLRRQSGLAVLAALVGMAVSVKLRSDMLGYAEGKVYDGPAG